LRILIAHYSLALAYATAFQPLPTQNNRPLFEMTDMCDIASIKGRGNHSRGKKPNKKQQTIIINNK